MISNLRKYYDFKSTITCRTKITSHFSTNCPFCDNLILGGNAGKDHKNYDLCMFICEKCELNIIVNINLALAKIYTFIFIRDGDVIEYFPDYNKLMIFIRSKNDELIHKNILVPNWIFNVEDLKEFLNSGEFIEKLNRLLILK